MTSRRDCALGVCFASAVLGAAACSGAADSRRGQMPLETPTASRTCITFPAELRPEPSREFLALWDQAAKEYHLGDFAEARTTYDRLRSERPDLPGPWRYLASLAWDEGRWWDCAVAASIALYLGPVSSHRPALESMQRECYQEQRMLNVTRLLAEAADASGSDCDAMATRFDRIIADEHLEGVMSKPSSPVRPMRPLRSSSPNEIAVVGKRLADAVEQCKDSAPLQAVLGKLR